MPEFCNEIELNVRVRALYSTDSLFLNLNGREARS